LEAFIDFLQNLKDGFILFQYFKISQGHYQAYQPKGKHIILEVLCLREEKLRRVLLSKIKQTVLIISRLLFVLVVLGSDITDPQLQLQKPLRGQHYFIYIQSLIGNIVLPLKSRQSL